MRDQLHVRRRRNSKRTARRSLWWRVYTARIVAELEYCRNCGFVSPLLTFDHLVPLSKGANLTFDNATILCEPCNIAKGAKRWRHLKPLAEEEVAAPPERQWFRLAAVPGSTPPADDPQGAVSQG